MTIKKWPGILQSKWVCFAKRFLLYILVTALLLAAGCIPSDDSIETARAKFDSLSMEIFREEASSDTLSLHIMLKSPEDYGIIPGKPSLPGISSNELQLEAAVFENRLARIKAIDRELLDTSQRLTYDIMLSVYENMLALTQYPYMSEPLSPNSGTHLYLPLLLTEFAFEDIEDVETYLALVECIPDLLGELETFEREKSAAGMFMIDDSANLVISQCRSFCEEDPSILVSSFNERVNALDFLDKDERKAYRSRNKKLINETVIPAYKSLADSLELLLGTGRNPNGLCYFDGGRDYYERYVQLRTGTDKTVPEMKESLETLLSSCLNTLREVQAARPEIINDYYAVSFPGDTPEASFEYLLASASDLFPSLEKIECEFKELPKNLRTQAGAAMYLIPAIDGYDHNVVYINSNASGSTRLFPTIAHEAYPGHLLQTVSFYSSGAAPVRHVLPVLGYDEGWAIYCEVFSYALADLDDTLTKYLQANMLALHCLYSLTDIGINYEGWTEADSTEFLCRYGLSLATAGAVRSCTLGDPGLYLPYSIGYIEITELLDEYRSECGESFSLRNFHTALLETGPAPFGIIREYLY